MKTRIFFLDHLRTLSIFLVVLLHSGIVYEQILENIWIVSDPVKNGSIGLVRMYLDIFVMYTIFFVSGYFVPISLKNKDPKDFLTSKVKRILLPWFVAVFSLIPAYKIIFLYSRGLPQEVWYSYFHIFERAGADPGLFSNNPSQNWLWFLPVLFVFQVLYLVVSRLKLPTITISLKTSVLLTILIGVVYSMLISNAGLTGWQHSGFLEFQRERLLPYFLVFLVGAQCQKLKVFDAPKNVKHYIISNVVLTLSLGVFTVVALNLFFNLITPGRNYFFISDQLDRVIYYFTALLSMFSLLYVLIHAFRFNFNKTNHIMNQLNKNSYSVYIIHVIVLGLIAVMMTHISIPAIAKYLLLTVLTFLVSNVAVYVYDRLIEKRAIVKFALASLFIASFFMITSSSGHVEISKDNEQHTVTQTELPAPEPGLHEAVIQGNIEAIQQHIEAGSNLDAKDPSGGSSPLITAAVFGKTEIALLLINSGANVDFQNDEGSTPLITAAFFCNVKIVEILLANKADRNIRNNEGSTAIDAVSGPFEEVEIIYDYFQKSLGPLGLNLDYAQIKKDRPKITEMLQN